MRVRLITKTIKITILILGIVYIWNIAPHSMVWMGIKSQLIDSTKNLNIQEGDFIFQNIHGKIFRLIEGVTGNSITHCGIIVKKDGEYYVLEAIGPVMYTPLNKWIHRGIGSQMTIVRLKEEYQNQIPKIIQSANQYLNRPYDIQYEWDDEKIYCSELIYKSVKAATGLELAEFRRLGDMDWQPYEALIRSIAGGKLPLDRMMIPPGDLVVSEGVNVVYSNFRK